MKFKATETLTDLLGSLSAEVVRAQRLLDAAHIAEIDRYLADAQTWLSDNDKSVAPAHLEAYLRSVVCRQLTPVRQMVASCDVDAAVSLTQVRSRGFAIKAVPINVSYQVQFESSATIASRVKLTVEQIPVDQQLADITGLPNE